MGQKKWQTCAVSRLHILYHSVRMFAKSIFATKLPEFCPLHPELECIWVANSMCVDCNLGFFFHQFSFSPTEGTGVVQGFLSVFCSVRNNQPGCVETITIPPTTIPYPPYHTTYHRPPYLPPNLTIPPYHHTHHTYHPTLQYHHTTIPIPYLTTIPYHYHHTSPHTVHGYHLQHRLPLMRKYLWVWRGSTR